MKWLKMELMFQISKKITIQLGQTLKRSVETSSALFIGVNEINDRFQVLFFALSAFGLS